MFSNLIYKKGGASMKFLRYLREVFLSSLPLAIVIVITAIIFPPTGPQIFQLAAGYVAVVIGQALFLVGIDKSILPMGKLVGNSIPKLKKTIFVLLFGFIFGFLATAAEPAISVLAKQINIINEAINSTIFIFLVAFGTGVMVGFAIFRIVKNINIRYVFLTLYIIIFAMVIFVPNQYIALAFDASGATTGDVSVPFILAMGLGISHTASKSKSNDESFGILGIASTGSIITVFIYGMIKGNSDSLTNYIPGEISTIGEILLDNIGAVALAIIPIVMVFLIFQFFFIKLPKKQVLNILIAGLIVFAGLYIFLVGIDYGFAFAGKYIGEKFMDPSMGEWFKWLMVPLGFVLGFAITITEPGVVVLGEQVEELTNGHLSKRVIKMTLGLSIGIASVIAMIKILLDIPIVYLLAPLYAIALILMFFTPKLFVGLAFDSGGVTGGAITSAFLTPLTLGLSQALEQNMLISGLGIIGFISVTPLIIIQILGMIYSKKMKSVEALETGNIQDELDLLHQESDNKLEVVGTIDAEGKSDLSHKKSDTEAGKDET